MISVQNVYATVLSLLNKEQRGYVGPSEFNNFAKLAQQEIFEQYFTDLASQTVSPKGMQRATGYSDLAKNLKMKIDVFANESTLVYNSTTKRFALPTDIYRLDTIEYNPDASTYTIVPEFTKEAAVRVQRSLLMRPSAESPRYERFGNDIRLFPDTITSGVSAQYIKTPATPQWAYNAAVAAATDGTQLFDASLSTDFELHVSEEYRLVKKILEYAGVSTKELDISQFGTQGYQQDIAIKNQI